MLVIRTLGVLLLATAPLVQAAAGDLPCEADRSVTFEDSAFGDHWSFGYLTDTGDDSWATGDANGGVLEIETALDILGNVQGTARNAAATWHPADDGSVLGLAWTVDVRMIDAWFEGPEGQRDASIGQGWNVQAYIEQGGWVYTKPIGLACTPEGCEGWHTVGETFCAPASFSSPFQNAPPLDLQGSELTFGLIAANSGNMSFTETFHLLGEFDHWKVEVLTEGPTVVPVDIDIKPGSNPSALHVGARHTVPVAIFGDEALDAGAIDPRSIELLGMTVREKRDGTPQAALEHVDDDAHLDLVVHLDTATFQDGEPVLIGALYDGTPIEGRQPEGDPLKILGQEKLRH